MTDATSQANGRAPGAESARRASPDLDGTPRYGAAAGGTAPTAPDSGEASAWPGWPGVARPAGWFLPASGEAPPPVRPGMQPVRADAGPELDSEPGPRYSAGPDEPGVVGPTPALRGRAGGPGFVVPPGAVRGLHDQAHRSGWQLAQQVWQESGINWEPPAGPASAESPADEPEQEPGCGEDPHGGLPGQSRPTDAPGQAAPQPAFAELTLGAPTLAGTP